MKRPQKVLALFDAVAPTTIDQDLTAELQTTDWQTEANVLEALTQLGCPHEHLAIFDTTDHIREKVRAFEPDLIFNLADQFKNNRAFDQNIVSFLEMQDVPFTGCGSTGLTLCKHKGISKKILGYHHIRVPQFAIIPRRGSSLSRPRRLAFPLIVKPLKEEASLGISQASLVENDEQFRQRVAFVHEKFDHDAIAEEFIEGRELYVSVMGNRRLRVFPIRELKFKEVPTDDPKIATYKVKWDEEYRKRWGIVNDFADPIDPAVVKKIEDACRRIYRLLLIDGYARIDLRLTPQNQIVFIEANPNPILAKDEDFAESARAAGLEYPQLIQEIMRLGLRAVRD
jgi:D-alanine-D-alanine ligase